MAQANRRFGPWVSLAVGTASALLWRRGVDQVRASVVLASLAAVLGLLLLFPPWEEARSQGLRAHPWVRSAAGWATVNLAKNALWFVIPFYAISTTWPSRNVPFTVLLVALGVLSCFDAFLRERVLRDGWSAVAFVAPALLAALQLFLPLLSGVPPRSTVFVSGALVAAACAFLAAPDTLLRRRPAVPALLALAGVAAIGAVAGRVALPLLAPAPLRLASAHFALGRDHLEPVAKVETLSQGGAAFVFVAVEAPRGLSETVRLVVEGESSRETRPLEISGGRPGGYRLWAPVRPAAPGRLHATVRTEGGQIVGAVSADVTAVVPGAAPKAPER